jgi:hypothetical protein
MDSLPVRTFYALLPIVDDAGRIERWGTAGVDFPIIAPDVPAALAVARKRYGTQADVIASEDVAAFRGF